MTSAYMDAITFAQNLDYFKKDLVKRRNIPHTTQTMTERTEADAATLPTTK